MRVPRPRNLVSCHRHHPDVRRDRSGDRAGSGDAARQDVAGGRRPAIPRLPRDAARPSADRRATPTSSTPTATRRFRRCSRRSTRRSIASASRPTSSTRAGSPSASPTAFEAAARRGVEVRLVLDSVGASTMDDRAHRAAGAGGLPDRLVQPGGQLRDRGGELPHAPQGAGRRRRRRVRRRHRHRRPVGVCRARTRRSGATRTSRSAGRPRSTSRRRSTRTGSRPAASSSRTCCRTHDAPAERRESDRRLELAGRRRQRAEAALPAGDRRRAVDARHPVAVPDHRRIDAVEPERGAAARRPHPAADRGRHHRRQAGEVRRPRRLRAAAWSRASRSTSTSRR